MTWGDKSEAHRILRDVAKKWLKENFRFSDDQIHDEYPIGKYRVDVVGISKNLRVAVECGRTSIPKIKFLKKKFDHVKKFSYTQSINPKKALPASYTGVKREYLTTVRLNHVEYEMIQELAESLHISKNEVWRRLLWTVKTIFSSYLPARQAIMNVADNGREPSLADMLKPLPELMNIVLKEMERRKAFEEKERK